MNSLLKAAKRSLFFLLTLWFATGVVIGFLTVYPFLHFTLSSPSKYPMAQKIRKVWFNWCLLWGGIRVKQIVEVPLDRSKTFVITPNHTSKLDMITLMGRLGIDFIFMGKDEFKKIPLFGLFFKTIDIPVDFNNAFKSARAYIKARKRIEEGTSITIYPEATIDRHTPKLSPFKDGAFRLAIEMQVDILPVTAIGHWKLLSDFDKYYFSPGTVIQYVHAPVSTKGLTLKDIPELKQNVFNIIASKLSEYGYKQ
ncbi:MAG: lysophospholipid acyltransferase family protein [Bacteroidota bacterium]|jgi:1-acyl-sn-glycerol-3-phosphate acyltransferase